MLCRCGVPCSLLLNLAVRDVLINEIYVGAPPSQINAFIELYGVPGAALGGMWVVYATDALLSFPLPCRLESGRILLFGRIRARSPERYHVQGWPLLCRGFHDAQF